MLIKQIQSAHTQWQPLLYEAISHMDKAYCGTVGRASDAYCPRVQALFAAFSEPLDKVHYVLLGESPYPRLTSANGYAFWDEAVGNLWSDTGFAKAVNRATSLRNMMKMLLLARGDLTDSLSQPAIAALDKSLYWQTASQLFRGLLAKGFLLLNASLVYEEGRVSYHAKQWRPFIRSILEQLNLINPSIELLLFGKIAHQIPGIDEMRCLIAEHPYNLSFIQNPHVLEWFKPLDLLRAHDL